MTTVDKPTRPNKALVHARLLTGDTQRVAAERIGVSGTVISKAERGIDKLKPEQLDRYYQELHGNMSKAAKAALVYDKKGNPKGMIGIDTISSVRVDKKDSDVLVVTSKFTLPGRKGHPAKVTSWNVRVHKVQSPNAFKLAKAFKKA